MNKKQAIKRNVPSVQEQLTG